jgi:hypothetical protein
VHFSTSGQTGGDTDSRYPLVDGESFETATGALAPTRRGLAQGDFWQMRRAIVNKEIQETYIEFGICNRAYNAARQCFFASIRYTGSHSRAAKLVC